VSQSRKSGLWCLKSGALKRADGIETRLIFLLIYKLKKDDD